MAKLSDQLTLRGGLSGKARTWSFTQQSSGCGWRTESILRRFWRDIQHIRDFFHTFTFGQQLQHFTLSLS